MYNNLPWIFGLAKIKKKNEKFSNQQMLLIEYHPGHPSTENKFKILKVNLSSSVNHKLCQEYSLVVWDFYIHLFSSHIVYR